jgi:hypothetical protein
MCDIGERGQSLAGFESRLKANITLDSGGAIVFEGVKDKRGQTTFILRVG